MAGGRPSGFDKLDLVQVEKLTKAGFTDAQLADFFGTTEQTWNNWKKAHPKFFESLKDWKSEADHEVEKSLYHRAKGYNCTDTKFATNEGKISDSLEYTKHYPPDTTAAIFWLKNRQPKEWRDRIEQHHTGDGSAFTGLTIVKPKGE